MAGNAHRDYSHRSVVDKLGIKSGHAVACNEDAFPVDAELWSDILQQTGRDPAGSDESPDVVLLTARPETDVTARLRAWRMHLQPTGAIWVLTPKRGHPGYLNQTDLIGLGLDAGLVDNKSCSISDTVSGMRFVIRRADRARVVSND